MIRVLDVSGYTGPNTDWAAVAAMGVRGVYVEAQIGNDGPNPLLGQQLAGARAAGLAVGVYLFAEILPDAAAHPNRDPEDQVRLAFDAVGGQVWEPGDLPPMLDCESPDPSRWTSDGVSAAFAASWMAAALDALDARFQRSAGIYTYAPWWRALGGAGAVPGFADRVLWMAAYPGAWDRVPPPDGTPFPAAPPPWGAVTLWQHGDKIALPSGQVCDGSVFAGDEAAWGRLLGLPPSAVSTVPDLGPSTPVSAVASADDDGYEACRDIWPGGAG